VPLAFHSRREADHSPPSSAEVKEWVELYLHSLNTPSWRCAQGEHRDNFFYLYHLYLLKSARNLFTLGFPSKLLKQFLISLKLLYVLHLPYSLT
jgi:thiosulfate reductase cytochrome b subunit